MTRWEGHFQAGGTWWTDAWSPLWIIFYNCSFRVFSLILRYSSPVDCSRDALGCNPNKFQRYILLIIPLTWSPTMKVEVKTCCAKKIHGFSFIELSGLPWSCLFISYCFGKSGIGSRFSDTPFFSVRKRKSKTSQFLTQEGQTI